MDWAGVIRCEQSRPLWLGWLSVIIARGEPDCLSDKGTQDGCGKGGGGRGLRETRKHYGPRFPLYGGVPGAGGPCGRDGALLAGGVFFFPSGEGSGFAGAIGLAFRCEEGVIVNTDDGDAVVGVSVLTLDVFADGEGVTVIDSVGQASVFSMGLLTTRGQSDCGSGDESD